MARTGRGCPSAHVVARMKLLPTETVRATASHSNHERLVARLRQTEVEKLYTLASGGWMQYTVDSWCVLISTADVSQRLEVAVYEPLTLHVPIPHSHGKRQNAGEPATLPLHTQISAIHMLPGKGSSLARRAIVTVRI